MNAIKGKPIGIALCICESVITEAVTNKNTLVGMFNTFGSVQFPAVLAKMCVFVSVTGGHGALPTVVRCVNDETGTVVFEIRGTISFQQPNQIAEANFQFLNVAFVQPGMHCIELRCDDELVLQRQFQVMLIPQGMKQ